MVATEDLRPLCAISVLVMVQRTIGLDVRYWGRPEPERRLDRPQQKSAEWWPLALGDEHRTSSFELKRP
jgi:hypothetical protein